MVSDRTDLLTDVAATLNGVQSVEGVVRGLVATLVPEICDGCEVALPDPDGVVHRIALVNAAGAWAEREHVPVPDVPDHPVNRAIRTGEAELFQISDPAHDRWFGAEDDPTSARALGVHTGLVVPLLGRDRIFGALSAALIDPVRRWSEGDRAFLAAVGRLTALAIENLEALEHEHEARRRLSALAGAGVIGIISGENDRITDANDAFLEMVGLDAEEVATGNVRWTDLTPPEWLPQDDIVTAQFLEEGRADTFEKEYLHADGHRVPVMIGGATLSTEPFRWVVYVADLTARKEAERHLRRVADTLQQSLLPATLPDVPGWDIARHYWPAGAGLEVGGDFYDVFALDDGRFGVVIGDVQGKGVEAAATTAVCRHTTRAAGLHVADPAEVLRWVHNTLVGDPSQRFCTLAYAVIDGDLLSLSIGGHPQPLQVTARGEVRPLGNYGTLLGIFEPKLSSSSVTVGADDLVAFYTDGVTDAPGDAGMDEHELGALLASVRTESLESIGEAVGAELAGRQSGVARDDVALLLLRRRPTAA